MTNSKHNKHIELTFIFRGAQHILNIFNRLHVHIHVLNTIFWMNSNQPHPHGKQIQWFILANVFILSAFVNSWRYLYYQQTVYIVHVLIQFYYVLHLLYYITREALLPTPLNHFSFSNYLTRTFWMFAAKNYKWWCMPNSI